MDSPRYSLVPILIVALAIPATLWGADSNLTVLSSSEVSFRFVYSFTTEISRIGADSATVSTDDLTRVLQVGVPPGAEARLLSALGENSLPLPANLLIPPSDNSVQLVSISRSVMTRGRQSVGVKISPVADGLMYQQVEVEIGFDRVRPSGALSRASDPVFDRIWAASLANYDAAKNWPVEDRRPMAASVEASVSAGNLTAAGTWYKISVTQTGLVGLTGAQLESAGISLAGLKSDSIRIFNAGGLPNSVHNSDPRPQFAEISLLILDGGDGNFGRTDQLLFYGEAPSRWTYPLTGAPKYVNNGYTRSNIYWLAVSGNFTEAPRRMAQLDGTPSGSPVVDSCWSRVHLEQDNVIGIEADGHIWDYYTWYWSDQTSLSLQAATPGAIGSDSAYVNLTGRTNHNIDLSVNGVSATKIDCSSSSCQQYTTALRGGAGESNQLELSLAPISGQIPPFFDYLEIYYLSRLLPVNNRLDFALRDMSGDMDVRVIDAFTSTPTVFDISDPLHPSVITGFQRGSGFVTFHTVVSSDTTKRFFCGLVGQAASPASIARADFTDLRSGFSQTDMIVITAGSLRSSLDEYVSYRAAQGVAIQVVDVADVMDNFSYGLYDPTAIRDFLKFAYETYPDPAPSGVLFVGDASYDYLDHLGTGMVNYVPSYIRPTDRTYSDDNYVYFGDYGILDSDHDRGYDMMTARWPVRSASDINTIMTKTLDYESPSTFGTWRTRITLVADDEYTPDRDNETFHTTQTETLEKEHVPRFLNRQKIYLWDYPFVNREKPAVNDAIVDAFNEGTLIVNYVGHGNPDVWAHEHVLQRTSDLLRMHNADRLPLVYAASCDIGFFDDPQGEGMAEDFLKMASGGAIGVISATRLVYAADNAQFNRAVYDNLFANPDLSISEALFAAKVQRQYPNPLDSIPRPVDNDRAYTFMGDPCLRLAVPDYRVEFDTFPDSLVALEVSRLSGRILDRTGAPYNGSGVLYISVYDSDRQRAYHLANDTSMIRYAVSGPAIFRGPATVSGGRFDLQFITPLDIGYRGVSARVSAYAVLGGVDAIGMVDSIAVSERQSTAEDNAGPSILYSSVKRGAIRDGDFLDRDDSLLIRLSDISGLNLAGGIGHGVSLVIDGQVDDALNLTGFFQYDQDSYTVGGLVFPMAGITAGPHHFKIKAWDNVNNVATAEFAAEVGSEGPLAVRNLLNHPNPMSQSTTFYFELTKPVAEVQVSVYTLSGKNIWTTSRYDLQADRYPNGTVEISWDGRDSDGDRVGTGVYIYRLTASTGVDNDNIEEFGKVVVLN